MSIPSVFYTEKKLRILVRPDAHNDGYKDTLEDGTIRLQFRAPPRDGQANKALLLWLQKETGYIWRIQSGHTGHRKTVVRV